MEDGVRNELGSAEDIDIPAEQWFTIKIVHQASFIEGWLNGEKLLEIDDGTINEPGGVGVWTKDDAASLFDDLRVASG